MRILRRALALAALAASSSAVAQTPSASTPTAIVFTNVTLVDLDAGRLVPGRSVVIDGNRIAAVGPAASTRVPAGARVVDGRGKFLMPGMWDMHVHAASIDGAPLHMPLLVANGVTGVREMFGQLPSADSVAARIRAGLLVGPRIVAAGHILDGRPAIWPGSVSATTADEGRRAVDSLVARGADFIKVYSRLTPEAYRGAAEAAKRHRVPFAGHVPTLVSVEEASALGQATVEHMTGILGACATTRDEMAAALAEAYASPRGWDSAGAVQRRAGARVLEAFDAERCRALGRTLARNGTWMVPTLVTLHNTAHMDDTTMALDPRMRYLPALWARFWNPRADFRFRGLTPADWAQRRRAYARQVEAVALLRREGVRFLAGTDLSNPYTYPGFSLHEEIQRLAAAGLTPLDALRAATTEPARFLGMADSLGSVAPGRLADLVLLDADPLADVRNVARVHAVVADGRLVDAETRAKILADAERAAAATR